MTKDEEQVLKAIEEMTDKLSAVEEAREASDYIIGYRQGMEEVKLCLDVIHDLGVEDTIRALKERVEAYLERDVYLEEDDECGSEAS